jgi:hypothetical protein
MNTSNLKDTITTIASLLAVVAGAVNAYLQSNTGAGIDYFQLIGIVALAVIGYFTGKTPSGATKTDAQAAEQNPPKP